MPLPQSVPLLAAIDIGPVAFGSHSQHGRRRGVHRVTRDSDPSGRIAPAGPIRPDPSGSAGGPDLELDHTRVRTHGNPDPPR
jgi:hypothetical protein